MDPFVHGKGELAGGYPANLTYSTGESHGTEGLERITSVLAGSPIPPGFSPWRCQIAGGLSYKNPEFPWPITFSSFPAQGMENVWVCFGTVPSLPRTKAKSKTKCFSHAKRGEDHFTSPTVTLETQPLLPEVGNHKQVPHTLHKSVGGGNEGSLLPCVLTKANQTPVPTRANQEASRCK